MCSTHCTLSYRVLLFSFPTSNNFFQLVCSEITRESACWIQFWSRWCCLLLWHLKVIRIWLGCYLDFRYPCRKFLYLTFLFVSVVYTQNALKSAQFSRYSTTFLTILHFSSELSNNWGTGLPCLRPSLIYCTGQQHKASLFPCLFSCLSSICL